MGEREALERELARVRYLLAHPARDPWNWVIIIGVPLLCVWLFVILPVALVG